MTKATNKIAIISTLKCCEYYFPGHPEAPFRVKDSYAFLKNKDFCFIEPAPANEEDILNVHTKELLDSIKLGTFYDPDTPNLPNIYHYALFSAGAAIKVTEVVMKSSYKVSFSLMRPPGHHANKTHLGGFCYFNNIAIAVKHFLASALNGSVPSVAILDIDCHHGNGTQDIFLGEKNILYVSLHQVPLYPGTGLVSENNCLNFPLPPGTNEATYLSTLERALLEIKKFSPAIIFVSAGFDTYKDDPIAQLNLEKDSYTKISSLINSLNLPVVALLEGGYSKDLPELIFNFLQGFSI